MGIRSFQYNGLNYRKFTEPLDLDELYDVNVDDVEDPAEQQGFHQPMIEDFSAVCLKDLKPSDLKRYLLRVKNSSKLPDDLTDNYVAVIPQDIVDFGKMRLYGIYSEIYSVRPEDHFHVADSLSDAVTWLAGKNGLPTDLGPAAINYFENAAQQATALKPAHEEDDLESGSQGFSLSSNTENEDR